MPTLRFPPSALLAALGSLLAGCSMLYDFSTAQCHSREDCDALGGGFEGRSCSEQGICVTAAAGAGGNGGDGGPSGAGGSSGSAGTGPETGCESHADCVDSLEGTGEPAICKRADGVGVCIKLALGLDSDCANVLGDAEKAADSYLRDPAAHPYIIGVYAPTSGTASLSSQAAPNYELALQQFNTHTNGNKVLAVLCSSLASDEGLRRSLDHLVGDLEVPAIVAALSPAQLRIAYDYTGEALGSDVFLMNPFAVDRAIEDDPLEEQGGRLWNMLGDPADLAAAYGPLVRRAEAWSKARRLATEWADERTRVAVLMGENGLSRLASGVLGTLEINGAPLLQTANDSDRLTRNLVATEEVPAVRNALLDFRPHIIVTLTSDTEEVLIPSYEQALDAAGEPAPRRPFYVASLLQYNDRDFSEVARSPDHPITGRLLGVNYASASDETIELYNKYLLELEGTYPDLYGRLGLEGTENFYDAMWYTLYAVASNVGINVELLRGSRVTRRMLELIDPGATTLVNVGVLDLYTTLNTLDNGLTVQLSGTLGPPDFDTRGIRRTVASVWCIDADGAVRPDVFTYDEAHDELVAGPSWEAEPCVEGW